MQLEGVGSAVSSPSGVWGEAAADKRFGAYRSYKVQLWWHQFLLIFLRTNGGSNSIITGRCPMRSFFLPGQSAPLPYGSRGAYSL